MEKINTRIERFLNAMYNRNFNDTENFIKAILRVKITAFALKRLEENDLYKTSNVAAEGLNKYILNIDNEIQYSTEELYETMKKVTVNSLGHFPGDKEFFKEIYILGEDIELEKFIEIVSLRTGFSGILVPNNLENYVIKKIEKNKAKTILIAEADKSIGILKNIIDFNKASKFTLVVDTLKNELMFLLLEFMFKEYENVKVEKKSIYIFFDIKEKYDLIFSVPYFAIRFNKDSVKDKYLTRDSDGIAIENLIKIINDEGELLVIVPSRVTFGSFGFNKLRKLINEKYAIESIVSLPEGIFRPYTRIKTYIMGIKKEKSSEVILKKMELEGEALKLVVEKKVESSEFYGTNDWRIDLFLSKDADELRKFKESNVYKVKMKDIAEIFRGKSIMKKDIKPGNIHAVNISDIENGHINYENLDTIGDEERKVKRYELLNDDLIMSCRGTVNKVAVYKKIDKIVIATANIIVIRFKKNILSEYVKIFLESPIGKALIKSYQRGTTIMNINPDDIAELEIVLAPVEVQKKIVAKYREENEKYLETIKAANKRWGIFKENTYEEILK